MFDIGEKIDEFLQGVITDVLNGAFGFIGEVLFNPQQLSGFFQTLYNLFVAIGGMLLVCIVLYKVVVGLIESSRGQSSQADAWELIVDSVKASVMVIGMPFILWAVLGQVVMPLGEYMFSELGNFTADQVIDVIQGGAIGALVDGFVFIIIAGFIAIAVFAFFIKMCIYHADIVFLILVSPFAAVSIVADDNNYAGVWWREFLSQITTITLQVASMVGVVAILTGADGGDGLTWYNFMLLIGLCVILMRGPSVTRSMWYATGAGKGMNQGGKMSARMAMIGIKRMLT